jgi:hypothetical protein
MSKRNDAAAMDSDSVDSRFSTIQTQLSALSADAANAKADAANAKEKSEKLEAEVTTLKEDSAQMKKTLNALVLDRGMSVAVQTLLFATREQPLEIVEGGHGSCRFVQALTNEAFSKALGTVFNLEDSRQKLDKCKSWDEMNMDRNSKEHPNTTEELRDQAKLVKENLTLYSNGEDDPQQHIIRAKILEVVNNLSPLSKAVPNFGAPVVRSKKRKSEGRALETQSPSKKTLAAPR